MSIDIRPIPRLIRGPGAPGKGACWMSAIAFLSGQDKWTDDAKCVCPTIQPLAILLNDRCDDEERERLIGPHLFAPYGTAQGADIAKKRVVAIVRQAATWASQALSAAGLEQAAEKLARLPINIPADFFAASKAATSATINLSMETEINRKAAHAALMVGGMTEKVTAEEAARMAARMASTNRVPTIELRDLILRLCEIGRDERPDVELSRSLRELCTITKSAIKD